MHQLIRAADHDRRDLTGVTPVELMLRARAGAEAGGSVADVLARMRARQRMREGMADFDDEL